MSDPKCRSSANLRHINWSVRIFVQELLKPPHHRLTLISRTRISLDRQAFNEALDHDVQQRLLHRPADLRVCQNVGGDRGQATGYFMQIQQSRHQMRWRSD